MKTETFNAQRSTPNVQPVRDLHECAARTAAEHAEFQRFYQEHIVNSQLIRDLMSRNQLAAVEQAAWKAWRGARGN